MVEKKTQQERAQSYFKHHSKVDKLFATSDGFLFERNQDALSHSTTLKDKAIEVIHNTSANEGVNNPEANFLQLSVKKIEEALPEMEDAQALKLFLKAETESKEPRSTAIKAIEARIEALTNQA